MVKRQSESSSSDRRSEKDPSARKSKKSSRPTTGRTKGRRIDRKDSGRSFDRKDSGRSFDRKDRGRSFDRKDRGRSFDRPERKRMASKATRLRPISNDLESGVAAIEEEPDFVLPAPDANKTEVAKPADAARSRLKELDAAVRSGVQQHSETKAMRINRYLACCGLGSRREVEKLVVDRRVEVNGKTLDDLGYRVQAYDLVLVDGKTVRPFESGVYIALNKPPGYVVSRRSFPGNPSIYELLPPEYANLGYAGRLDRESRGLVILSSDGAFIQSIAHPRQGVTKRYLVTVDASIDDADLGIMTGRGVKHEGEVLRAISARVIDRKERRVEIILSGGRNRQIRRMFGALEYQVVDLQRVSVGRLSLEDHPVPEGEFFTFSPDELLSGEKTEGKDILKGFRPWKE